MTTIGPRLGAVLLCILLLAVACGSDDDSTEADAAPAEATAVAATAAATEDATYPVTVTSCGVEIVVEARPERVVAYTDAHTELFVALGLADIVVGEIWDFEALVRPENEAAVRAVEALASDSWPSREQVAALEPDFIFANAGFFDEVAPVEDFQSTGAVTYLPGDGCPEPASDVFAAQLADIENLGLIFGVQDRADELVEELRGGLDELSAALADVEPKPVLWVDYVFDDDRGVQLIASEFYAETVGLGGGELLLAGRDDTPSQEQIVAAEGRGVVHHGHLRPHGLRDHARGAGRASFRHADERPSNGNRGMGRRCRSLPGPPSATSTRSGRSQRCCTPMPWTGEGHPLLAGMHVSDPPADG